MLKQIVLLLGIAATVIHSASLGVDQNAITPPENRDVVTLSQDDFASEALMAHNLYRRIHGVGLLKLNIKLTDLAVRRAKELAEEGKLSVKQILFRGENLGETVGTVSGFSTYNGRRLNEKIQ